VAAKHDKFFETPAEREVDRGTISVYLLLAALDKLLDQDVISTISGLVHVLHAGFPNAGEACELDWLIV
jgi:hypothetical protein